MLALGDDLEGGAHLHDATRLDAALERDRERIRARLRELCRRADVREALFVASPSLEERLDGWLRDPDNARARKVERSLLRYLARMAGRATPFGLFAGCSVGTLGASGQRTRLRLLGHDAYRRYTSLDSRYLDALTLALQRDPAVRRNLRYVPNSSLYRAAGRLRYTEARPAGTGTSYHLVAVEPSAHLCHALRRAATGARPGELAAAIRVADTEVGADEASDFVEELIANQILVCELAPAVSGPEPIDDILEQLAAVAEPDTVLPAADALARVRTMLTNLDRRPPGSAPARYREVAAALGALPVQLDPSSAFHVDAFHVDAFHVDAFHVDAFHVDAFHVDLMKPAAATLGRDVVEEIARGVRILHRIGSDPRRDPFDGFREAFHQRYGMREVPLCEVLDDDVGIGFPATDTPGASPDPLLDGLAFPLAPDVDDARFGKRDGLMLRWLAQAAERGADEIALGADELRSLEEAGAGSATPPLPDSFSAVATILAASEQAIADGRYRVVLSSAGGPSGMNLVGRFCRRDESLTRHVLTHLRAEEALQPDAVFAEIVHRPPGKVGNVLVRPHLRDHEIVYLARSASTPERRIELTDLMVSVARDRVTLRSRQLDCEIVPRLSTAHNFGGGGNLSLYRFLCGLQRQGLAGALSFSFGALEHAPHLPRVTAGRMVLSRARWNLYREQLAPLAALTGAARFAALQDLRRRLRLPRWVALVAGDQRLPIDLDSVLFVDTFVELLRGRASVTLEELFYGPTDVFAAGPEGRFVHELVVPFLRVEEPTTVESAPGPRAPLRLTARRRARPVVRSFPPGSEWLYAKMYTGAAGADTVLRQIVRPVVSDALSGGAADRWFYVRYADPDPHIRLRLHGDRVRLLGEVLPALLDGCARLHADGRVWRTQLDTYEREVERYGGPAGIVLAEQLFHVDSDAALHAIETVPGDEGADGRWRLVLFGLDRLLDDLSLDLPGRLAVVRAARDQFGREFREDRAFRRRLGDRFRRERTALDSLLDPDTGRTHPGQASFVARSRALRPVVSEMVASARAGHLTRPLPILAGNFLHLHANRMLRSAARAHELVLYDLLCRWYGSRVARQRDRGPAPPRRS